MRVYIAQLKCPANHCVVAAVDAYETRADAEELGRLVMERFKQEVDRGALNYECGLCKSTNLHVDLQPTIFKSREEARLVLRRAEAAQLATAQMLKESRN